MIKRLLIANRGEIAVRIIRTARELGVTSIVAHSEADAGSMAVAMADESICLGPAEAALSLAWTWGFREGNRRPPKESSADASAHPGYGFLSERAELGRCLRRRGGGITVCRAWPAAAMRTFWGSKIASKALGGGN